jgi:hypothetical protein
MDGWFVGGDELLWWSNFRRLLRVAYGGEAISGSVAMTEATEER